MELNQYMFREYDIREEVDKLKDEHVMAIGKAFGTRLVRQGLDKVVVGYDFREYSERIKNLVLEGLMSTGLHVIDIGLCLTPMLYFAQHHFKSKGGVMVTASHNPNGWTGFKLSENYSLSLVGDDIKKLHAMILAEDFEVGEGSVEEDSVTEAYMHDVLGRVEMHKPMKVVVECGNGTAGAFVPEILRNAGCDVVEVNCELDASFPNHNPNPELKEVKALLAEKVKEHKADIGIGFDGDGDRLGVVDDKGMNIWSDWLLALLARQALANKPGGTVVFDVKCSQALPEDIEKHGGKPLMWRTGHSYIKQKCRETDAVLGGERSGHFFILDNYYGFDDAVFSSLRLLEYLSEQDEPLSALMQTIPRYPITPTIHVHCPDDKKYGVVEKLVTEFKKDHKVIDIGCARVLFKDGWGLVRASSNEPVLVLVFEATSEKLIEDYKILFREKLGQFPEVAEEWQNE